MQPQQQQVIKYRITLFTFVCEICFFFLCLMWISFNIIAARTAIQPHHTVDENENRPFSVLILHVPFLKLYLCDDEYHIAHMNGFIWTGENDRSTLQYGNMCVRVYICFVFIWYEQYGCAATAARDSICVVSNVWKSSATLHFHDQALIEFNKKRASNGVITMGAASPCMPSSITMYSALFDMQILGSNVICLKTHALVMSVPTKWTTERCSLWIGVTI